jgi:hypothetical protein
LVSKAPGSDGDLTSRLVAEEYRRSPCRLARAGGSALGEVVGPLSSPATAYSGRRYAPKQSSLFHRKAEIRRAVGGASR